MKANKYRLKVLFCNGMEWNIKCHAISSEAVATLLPQNETKLYCIKSLSIEMTIFEDVEVKENFILKVID